MKTEVIHFLRIAHKICLHEKDWAALVNTLVESGCTWTAQVQVVD